jgi:hypothetical protein
MYNDVGEEVKNALETDERREGLGWRIYSNV